MGVYLIYACETEYEGLHGMNKWDIVECNNYRDACDVGHYMSCEVIESYTSLQEEIDEEAREIAENDGIDFDSPEADSYISDVFEEHVCYYVDELDNSHTYDEWCAIARNMDYDEFYEKYVEKKE